MNGWALRPERLLVGLAVDRRLALADSARIHGDDVEAPVEDRELARPAGLEGVRRGRARPAEVDEQRADPVRRVGRRRPGDEQLHGGGPRVPVVERRGDGRALHAGRRPARLPAGRGEGGGRPERRRPERHADPDQRAKAADESLHEPPFLRDRSAVARRDPGSCKGKLYHAAAAARNRKPRRRRRGGRPLVPSPPGA